MSILREAFNVHNIFQSLSQCDFLSPFSSGNFSVLFPDRIFESSGDFFLVGLQSPFSFFSSGSFLVLFSECFFSPFIAMPYGTFSTIMSCLF